jgi:uncharacterized protein YxjI
VGGTALTGGAEFYDAQNRPLFQVVKRIVAIHATFDVTDFDNDDKVLATISKRMSFGGAKFKISFKVRPLVAA